MKTWIAAILATVVGMAVGAGMMWSEFASAVSVIPGQGRAPTGEERVATVDLTAAPKVVVEGGSPKSTEDEMFTAPEMMGEEGHVYDFGAMLMGETGKHTFIFRNEGQSPLTLEKGHFTCSCTLANLSDNVIPPGGSMEVVLEWTPKDYTEHFQHGGEIHTNDPRTPLVRLGVKGRVTQEVRMVPGDVVFNNVSSNEPHEGSFVIYDYRNGDVSVTGHRFLNADTADYFEANVTPLSAEDVTDEPGAKGGVQVTITTKPGLPLGQINQKIRLDLNRNNPNAVEAPIRGQVVGDITFAGQGYNSERARLTLGTVRRGEGAERTLHVMIKGPHRHEVELRVGRISPEGSLEAELGEPRVVGDGAVVMVPLVVRVPPGAPLGDYLGTRAGEIGEIELETTHPDTKKAKLQVSFLVEQTR